jgi:hypothetical protein
VASLGKPHTLISPLTHSTFDLSVERGKKLKFNLQYKFSSAIIVPSKEITAMHGRFTYMSFVFLFYLAISADNAQSQSNFEPKPRGAFTAERINSLPKIDSIGRAPAGGQWQEVKVEPGCFGWVRDPSHITSSYNYRGEAVVFLRRVATCKIDRSETSQGARIIRIP